MKSDVLLRCQVHVQAGILKDDAYALAHVFRLSIQIMTCYGYGPAGLRQGRSQDRDRRGLSSAVGPEKGEELAGTNIEAQPIHCSRLRMAIALY
jgi:hypothetical protein